MLQFQDIFYLEPTRLKAAKSEPHSRMKGWVYTSPVFTWYEGEKESEACKYSYVQDSNDVCPPEYLVNADQCLEKHLGQSRLASSLPQYELE